MSRVHGELSIRRVRPCFSGTIDVQLHSIAIGITQVKRLAHAVIGSAFKPDAGSNQPPQRIRQRRAVGIDDGVMVEAGCAERRRRAVQALPCVQSNVMVITAGGKKRSLVAHALHEFKAQARPDKNR